MTDDDNTDDDNDDRPTGFLGRLRSARPLAWALIIGLVALTIGGTTLLTVLINN